MRLSRPDQFPVFSSFAFGGSLASTQSAPIQNEPHRNAMGKDSHIGKNWMAAENTKGKRNIAQNVFCRGVLIIRLSPDVDLMR
jgi:hypothetical protein